MVTMEGYEHYKIHHEEIMKSMRRSLREQFKINHKKALLILDTLVILAILFNFGALTITNTLVMKDKADANETVVFKEVNPVSGAFHGFETVPVTIVFSWLIVFLKQALLLGTLVWFYVRYRSKVFCWASYWRLSFIVTLLLVMLANDFFHDLGFWIGHAWWLT